MKKTLRLLRYVLRHPLNRVDRLNALSRVLRWQLGARLLPGACALPFVDDTHLFVTHGMTGATGNWYCGLHEVDEMAFVLHALRPGELFMDVGANIGSYTVLAAGAVGADVISIEPVPATFNALRRNVRLNDLGAQVHCVNAGLGEGEGELRFTSGRDTANHVLASGERGDGVVVPVRRLDDLCAERIPAIIKIDVEGYEQAVIAGGGATLANEQLQAVIMETNGSKHRYGWDDEHLIETMHRYGFTTCAYDPFARQMKPAPTGAANTVFCRNIAAAQHRVDQAQSFRLVNGVM